MAGGKPALKGVRARRVRASKDKAIRFGVAMICFLLALYVLLAKPLRAEQRPTLSALAVETSNLIGVEIRASLPRRFFLGLTPVSDSCAAIDHDRLPSYEPAGFRS